MQNFDDLDIEGRMPSHLSEEEREKEEHERKRLMRSSVTAEDGILRPVYSETEDGDIWCHICNIALYGAHKLLSHNSCNRHKLKLDDWPYPVLLWSKRSDIVKKNPIQPASIGSSFAPGEPAPPGMEDQIKRNTAIQMSLDRHRSSPLVGLEYLFELVDNDSCEPSYTCVLCDKRGDPRTVMAHITSWNHRITYLNRHFPTISRAISELPRTANYKRGANEISILVAKKIEEHFGRLYPQLVDKNLFEKNKMQYIKQVCQDYHFRETPELTFMEVYDVRWVTNFEEKMAEISASTKKDLPPVIEDIREEKMISKDEKKKLDKSPKRVDSKSETSKSGFKIRIMTKDKLNLRKSDKSEITRGDSKKLSSKDTDDIKSLSSLSSISSSPSPTRSKSKSRSPVRYRKSSPLEKSRDRHHRHRSRYSRDRSRSRSPDPLRERDKWEKYKEQIRRAEETLDRALKFHEKNPEKHPAYPDEWKKFWNRRYKELQSEGKDPAKHDFKPEWIEFWNKRMRELHNDQVQQRKEEIRKRLELPDEKPPEKWPSSRNKKSRSPINEKRKHRTDSDDDVEYVKTIKPVYQERHDPRDRDYYTYARSSRSSSYRSYYNPVPSRPRYHATPYPVKEKSPSPIKEDLREDLEIVGLLRLLTALEGQLGSLGPKIVSLLSKALAAEKVKPNSAEELLYDEEVSVLFETVKEKLKGQLFAGMIEKMAIPPTKSAIQNIAQLLHKAAENKKKIEEEKKKKQEELLEMSKSLRALMGFTRPAYPRPIDVALVRSEPVSVPGVGAVDKAAIAQQIAAALISQGRTDVSQEELETLINAVVGMAEASKHSDKPVTTADFVKGLSATAAAATNAVEKVMSPISPIVTAAPVVMNTPPIKSIDIAESKAAKMESLSDDDLKSLLQNFKELNTDEQHGLINFLKKLEATDPARVEKLRAFVNLGPSSSVPLKVKSPSPEILKSCRSSSPFSNRKGNQNPSDDDKIWKPKYDMFADEEEEKKAREEEKTKKKLELSDDDDDYSFEDIYKAADKNVSESEKAKRNYSRSRSHSRSWSRSHSRSCSRSPRSKPSETKTSDPNVILNETKKLIENIMGDLPSKYAVKSHIIADNQIMPRQQHNMDVRPNVSHTMSVATGYNPSFNPGIQQLGTSSQHQQQPPVQQPSQQIPYQNHSNQFQNYQPTPQQMFSGNPNYMNNGYNNYNQSFGNAPPSNQGQFNNMPIPQSQFGSQQNFNPSQYGASSGGYAQQQQQYGNFPQRFY